MKKVRENRNGKPMKRKPKPREEKRKLNIKKRWDHLSSANEKHWMSLLQSMLHYMEKKTGRFLHMKEMSLLSDVYKRQMIGIHSKPSPFCPVGRNIRNVLDQTYDMLKENLISSMKNISMEKIVSDYHSLLDRDS